LALIKQADDPTAIQKCLYAEHFMAEAVEIPRCVEEELHFGFFAEEGFASSLRSPRYDILEMQTAKEVVTATMPTYYGEPSGKCFSTDNNLQAPNRWKFIGGGHSKWMNELSSLSGFPGVRHGGSWRQPLNWYNNDPETLRKAGVYNNEQVQQVKRLEQHALGYFGARRCVGLGGSYRPKTMPIAGSLMWSLLLYGKSMKAWERVRQLT
jgi:hypothetical protein